MPQHYNRFDDETLKVGDMILMTDKRRFVVTKSEGNQARIRCLDKIVKKYKSSDEIFMEFIEKLINDKNK